MIFVRFIFGLLIGSFLNVVALRYREDKFVFNPQVIGGRSRCPHCKKELRWFELFPVLSFAVQGGRCRDCGKDISWLYPSGEILSGLIFAFVPLRLAGAAGWIWVAAFEILLLISLIDFRLRLIPDELTVFLGALGIVLIALQTATYNLQTDFVGPYRYLFGLQDNVWLNFFFGAAVLAAFFYAVAAVTRGRGMGFGDVKLAFALGLLFGWPGGVLAAGTSFIIGGLAGLILILFRKKNRKSALPFAPFLALGAFAFFMWSGQILSFYFTNIMNWAARLLG